MARERVRFLHSGDWRLEESLSGVAQVPAPLQRAFIDAPFQAAERVVDVALREQVDFLLLTGDVLLTDGASPYAFEFLLSQFQRLHEQKIQVYWIGGVSDDPDLWPAQLTLPANVKVFSGEQVEHVRHLRDGKSVAEVMGRSHRIGQPPRLADYGTTEPGVPQIALIYGLFPEEQLESRGIEYWAAGGCGSFQHVERGPATACSAGSPQGWNPRETQPHGAVLVEHKFGETNVRLIETALWRWHHDKLELPVNADESALMGAIRQRAAQLQLDGSVGGWLTTWTITCGADLWRRLRQPQAMATLLNELQQSAVSDRRWTVSISLNAPQVESAFLEEDSVCGDFLRVVSELQDDAARYEPLLSLLPNDTYRDELASELKRLSDDEWQQMWRQVAFLGCDLLNGNLPLTSGQNG